MAKPWAGKDNRPVVTAEDLDDILRGTDAANTGTLFLVEYSHSAYRYNLADIQPALNAVYTKAGASPPPRLESPGSWVQRPYKTTGTRKTTAP